MYTRVVLLVKIQRESRMIREWVEKIILVDEEIYIRTPKLEDIENIQIIWEDMYTMDAVGGPVYKEVEELEEWMNHQNARINPRARYFLIFNKKDELLGEVSFNQYNRHKKQAMFNVKVLYAKRGKGYGKRAMKLALDYYFNTFGGEKMFDDILPTNEIGQNAMLSFGFTRVKELPEDFVVYMDKRMFEKVKDE